MIFNVKWAVSFHDSLSGAHCCSALILQRSQSRSHQTPLQRPSEGEHMARRTDTAGGGRGGEAETEGKPLTE